MTKELQNLLVAYHEARKLGNDELANKLQAQLEANGVYFAVVA